MIISAVVVSRASGAATSEVTFKPIWESSSLPEISELSRFFRIRMPPPAQVAGNGNAEYRAASFGSYPAFAVTLKKQEVVVLTFTVRKGAIACEALCDFSAIGVDATALEPFYSRVTERLKRKAP